MVTTLGSFGALFSAALFFLMGNGVLSTLLSLRMAIEGFPTRAIGLVMSCYFLGLLAGFFLCHHLIQRVGHIRSFAAFAAVTTATVMLHGFYISATVWGVLRFLTGVTSFGLFMVVESWLNECTAAQSRGRIFSIYIVIAYMGIGIGQQLLQFGDVRSQELFFVVGILFSLSLVPVVVTRSVHPELPESERHRFVVLFRKAPIGVLGCITAGLINSAFYSLAPVFSTKIGLTTNEVSWLMTTTVFGGLTLQWLVGTISDRFDRTVILFIMSALISTISIIILINAGTSFVWLLIEMGLFGGFSCTIYPVSVARTYDIFEVKDAVPVSAGLLLSYSIGAIVGPIVASGLMTLIRSPYGLFFYWSLISTIFTTITIYFRRKERIEIIPVKEQVEFVPMKTTSSVAMVLDPRTEIESNNPLE